MLPGDELAVIEEFESGGGTYLTGWSVRSTSLGVAAYDRKQRIVTVQPPKETSKMPRPRDVIIGQVESAQPAAINVLIHFVNGLRNERRFAGMLIPKVEEPLRRPRGRPPLRRRRPTICKPGDLIRAKVVSNLNAIIHLALEDEEDGVIHTVCSLCGGTVTAINGRVKCVECGYSEERKLASDYGQVQLK